MPKQKAPSETEQIDALADEGEDDPSGDLDLVADDELGFVGLDDTDDFINSLWYGREGTGKTTDIASMAATAKALGHPGKILIVNAESGLKKRALAKRGIPTDNIVVWPNQAQGGKVSFKGLEALHERLLSDLMDDPRSWFGVGFDSATEITNALREQATERRQDKLRRAGKQFEESFIDRDDYGVMTDQLRRIFRRFRDLPCHFAVTALERLNEDESRGPVGVGPDLTPALASSLLGYVDYVLYCRATQTAHGEDDGQSTASAEFRAITRPHTRYRAKDRFDLTPRVLAEPTFERLHGYVMGDLDEDDDPMQIEYRRRREEERARKEKEAAEKAERKKGGAKKATAKKTEQAD